MEYLFLGHEFCSFNEQELYAEYGISREKQGSQADAAHTESSVKLRRTNLRGFFELLIGVELVVQRLQTDIQFLGR